MILKENDIRISLEEAQERLCRVIKPIERVEDLPILSCQGRRLAIDIVAHMDQPPFARSPLDGYAVRGIDTAGATKDKPIHLEVVEEVTAGDFSHRTLEAGQAIRIMTGAPIPKGANTVVMQEHTDYGEESVAIYQEVPPYKNYCHAGEDYKKGQVLIQAGIQLNAYHIGLLASLGMTHVTVKAKPKIAILSTGDELQRPGKALGQGQIYNSNQYTLAARLQQLECVPILLPATGDQVDVTARTIRDALYQVDLIITTGGVSVGKKDILHPVMDQLKAKRLFWKLDMKPGTPALASLVDDRLVLSLSGNPSAAAITFEVLFRPILERLNGEDSQGYISATATLGQDFEKKSPTRRLLRGVYQGGQVYLPDRPVASGALGAMVTCNCLIDIPKGNKGLHKGETVQIIQFC